MAITAACLCHSSHHHRAFPSGAYKYRSLAAGPPLARLRGFQAQRMLGSKRSQSRKTGGCPSLSAAMRRLVLFSGPRRRLRRKKKKRNRRRKISLLTKAMASVHVTSGTQSAAVKPSGSSARPQHQPKQTGTTNGYSGKTAMARVHVTSGTQSAALKPAATNARPQHVVWTKNGVGPQPASRPANNQGHRHVHLPATREEPMEVDPPRDEQEPMEVDPPRDVEEPMEVGPPLRE
ncbi:uncharacterized protein LOC121065891 isoform X1 [Cygnus olor]|uniref:uncharacterized protein LOC121065891 isoform X1 n=1 Tax=Cygnus olor TaxID=8869 RepID=UPI001ADDF149|nr:uncharacterized protein LOC121065891 isoform X1 [Cygnus olor]